MKTNFELTATDIKEIIADKFGVETNAVTFDVYISKADRPYESDTKVISAKVTMENTSRQQPPT